jgi:hypothetical protein
MGMYSETKELDGGPLLGLGKSWGISYLGIDLAIESSCHRAIESEGESAGMVGWATKLMSDDIPLISAR